MFASFLSMTALEKEEEDFHSTNGLGPYLGDHCLRQLSGMEDSNGGAHVVEQTVTSCSGNESGKGFHRRSPLRHTPMS